MKYYWTSLTHALAYQWPVNDYHSITIYDKLYPLIFLVQTNKIIVYSLSIDIRIMTGVSIIITGISQ